MRFSELFDSQEIKICFTYNLLKIIPLNVNSYKCQSMKAKKYKKHIRTHNQYIDRFNREIVRVGIHVGIVIIIGLLLINYKKIFTVVTIIKPNVRIV